MKKSKILTNIIPLAALVVVQAVYLALPNTEVAGFMWIQPVLYLSVIFCYLLAVGKDERPQKYGTRATILAGFAVFAYIAIAFILGVVFGFARNAHAHSFVLIVRNVWQFAVPVLCSEVLRFKALHTTPREHQAEAAVILTAVFTFIQLDAIRSLIRDGDSLHFFFVAFFPILALNAVLTYMTYNGSLASLLLVRGVFTLTPALSPFMPNLPVAAWAMVTSAILTVFLGFYYVVINDRGERFKRIERRRSKLYSKSRAAVLGILMTGLAAFAMFVFRFFPLFPVVVLTGSMTGAFDPASVVFIERVKQSDITGAVKEGDVILYRHDGIEVSHRIIEIQVTDEGETVYITKGDNNPSIDAYIVKNEDILGTAQAYVPYLGYPIVIIDAIFKR